MRVTLSMRKGIFTMLGISVLLLSVCCACAKAEPGAGDTTQNVDAKVLKTDVYSFVLPNSLSAKEGEDGSLALFLDGAEVGGVVIIPYENAEELRIEEINNEEGRAKFEELLNLVAPEGQEAHMFSTDTQDTFCLTVVPASEREGEKQTESIHYFFPKGDMFYDLFFQRDGSLSETEQQVIRDSFSLLW